MKIQNFRGVANAEIDLASITIVDGENGIGKTSILDAISWFFTDKNIYGSTKFEPIKKGENNCSVTLLYNDGNTLEKVLEYKDGISTRTRYFVDNDEIKANDFANNITELFNSADSEVLQCSLVYEYFLTKLTAENRRKIILNLFNIKENSYDLDTKKAELNKVKKEIENLQLQVSSYKKIEISSKNINEKELEKEIEKTKQVIAQKEKEIEKYYKKEHEHNELLRENSILEIKLNDILKQKNELEKQHRLLQKEYKEVYARSTDVCFNCKQQLPEDLKVQEFEKKQSELKNIIEQGKNAADKIKELQKEYTELQQQIELQKTKIKTVELELKKFDIKGENMLKNELKRQLEDLLKKAGTKQETNIDELIDQCDAKIKELQKAKLILESEIKELQNKRAEDSAGIEKQINSNFKNIEFTLFETLTNGEIKPACNILINEVDYFSASDSEKIRANIELMSKFREKYNLKHPLLIDRLECLDDEIFDGIIRYLEQNKLNAILTKVSNSKVINIKKIASWTE